MLRIILKDIKMMIKRRGEIRKKIRKKKKKKKKKGKRRRYEYEKKK